MTFIFPVNSTTAFQLTIFSHRCTSLSANKIRSPAYPQQSILNFHHNYKQQGTQHRILLQSHLHIKGPTVTVPYFLEFCLYILMTKHSSAPTFLKAHLVTSLGTLLHVFFYIYKTTAKFLSFVTIFLLHLHENTVSHK